MRRITCRILLLLSSLIGLLQAGLFYPDTAVMLHGAGYSAMPEGVGAVFLNPAGLALNRFIEIAIDIDPSFRYHSLGASGHLPRVGTFGINAYRNPSDGETVRSMAFGRRILHWGNTNRIFLLTAGLGCHMIQPSQGPDRLFSADPGLYFQITPARGRLKQLSFGAASYGLFAGSGYRHLNLGISATTVPQERNRVILTLGADLAHKEENRSGSFSLEIETWKNLFIMFGIWGRTLSAGFNIKGRTTLHAGLLYDQDGTETVPRLLTRFVILPVKPAAPPSSVRKEGAAPPPVRISPEAAEKQRVLLQEGIDLYSGDRLAEAVRKWEEVLKISPATEEARQAENYIRLVRGEIRRIQR